MAVTNKAGEVEYAGQVLSVWYDSVQIMSDVWESAVHFTYWTGEVVRSAYRLSYEGVTATADASDEVKATAAAWQEEQRRISAECHETTATVRRWYRVGHGTRANVVAGRKVPQGITVELTGPTFPSSYGSATMCNVRTATGEQFRYVDTDNLEVLPEVEVTCPAVMRCPECRKDRPADSFKWSARAGWGIRRTVHYTTDVKCVACEADHLTGCRETTDAHTLALAVLAGDLTAVCPLIDELIAAGKDHRADELKRLHKLDKPARKPRKRKADAVPA